MANVVALDISDDGMRAPKRLRALSKALSLLFTLLLGSVVFAMAGGVIVLLFVPQYLVSTATGVGLWFGPHGALPPLRPGMMRMSDQPLGTHVTGAVDWAIGLAPVFFVLWHLRKLFRLYAEGVVFAPSNATHLKHIGLWLIVYPFAKFVANMVFQLGGGTDHTWIHASELQALLLGLIVTAIAQVMEFGRDIEQEKDSFI
jgi:ABC-type xylose transport system permease subunit